MRPIAKHTDQTFADLLDFVEARGVDDINGTCRLCHHDPHHVDVGVMACDWVDRVRGDAPTGRKLAWTAWIAGIHHEHVDYRRAWDRIQTTLPYT